MGAEVLVVGPGTVEQARRYARDLRLPFPVAADLGRAVFRTYALDKVLLGLIQRSGVFLIDGSGVIRFAHAATNPQASLDIRIVLATLRGLAGPAAAS